MSLKAIRWAFQRHMNDATAKAVLVALAEHVEDGRDDCWPSAKRLGKYTALSERTVRATLPKLVKMGAINVAANDGKTPVCTLNFDWGGETLPRCATPRSRTVGKASTTASDAAPPRRATPAQPRRPTTATPASRAQTPASDADEPYEPLMNHKRGDEDFSDVPEGEDEDDVGNDFPPGYTGMEAIRPPSDRRLGGQRPIGELINGIVTKPGPPEKRRKRQDFADRDMLKALTSRCGMDGAAAYALVTAARNEEMDGHTEAARELEKLSRKFKLGFFVGETA